MDMKHLREKAGLRSLDVASKLGIAESTVRNWDIGRHSARLPIEESPEFLKVYQCTLEEAIEAAKSSKKKFCEAKNASDSSDRFLTRSGTL